MLLTMLLQFTNADKMNLVFQLILTQQVQLV